MKTFDLIRLRNFRNYFPKLRPGETGLISTDYTAPTGKVFVCLILGVEDRDGSTPLDTEAVMREHGWEFKE